MPVDEAVLAEDRARRFGMRLAASLEREAELEARPHPRQPEDLVAVDLPRDLLASHARGERDHRDRVGVVDVPMRHEGVQRRVDRARAGIEVPHAVAVRLDHRVLGRALEPAIGPRCVDALERLELLHRERREELPPCRAQVAAGSLHPQHLFGATGERIDRVDLRRRVAAAGVGDALIASKPVRSVDEPRDRIERRDVGVVPGPRHEAA